VKTRLGSEHLNGLLALKAVAEQNGFTAGARALGISASAISQTIRNLEKRLGVVLLTRTTRNTRLTEAGKKFLAEASPAIEQILSAIDNLGEYSSKPSGVLRLNLPRIVYPDLLEPIITSFANAYPEITTELFFSEGLSDVVSENFDAGIRLSELTAKDMIAIKLFGSFRSVVVGSPKYFDKAGRPKHPKDLISHNCTLFRFGEQAIYDDWEFEEKGRSFEVHVRGSVITNDPFVMLNTAINGVGLINYPKEAIETELRNGKLESVLEKYAPVGHEFYLYFPKSSQNLPKLRAFIDHAKMFKRKT
jgi:DNA-binding transcriptional LysR family regulator